MKAETDERLDHFTDRRDALAAYDALWRDNTHRRVVGLAGLSGIGKSTLLEFLLERHQPHRPAVLVNLADPRLLAGYLFVKTLGTELRLLFPNLRWRSYDSAERSAEEESSRLRALQPQITPRQKQSIWGRNAEISQSPQIITIDAGDFSAELDRRVRMHEERFRTQLLDALCRVLAAQAPPFAILVDTYEVVAHSADREFRAWFDHEFLPAIERRIPQARIVLAGREGLPGNLPQESVERWERLDSDEFLGSHGLTVPDLAAAIFRHCRGHPQVTSLAIDVWKAGVVGDDPLLPEQLRSAVNDRAATRWLMKQLYQRLPAGFDEVVKVAVRLRLYQPEVIQQLLPSNILGDDGFAMLSELSLTEFLPRGGCRAHDLVREVEDARFRQWPKAYRSFHLRASQYCHSAGDTVGSLYHGLAADEEAFAYRWMEEVENHRLSFHQDTVEELISLLEAPERRSYLGVRTVGLLLFEQAQLAESRANSGREANVTAHERLSQAEALFHGARDSFAQARSSAGVATATHYLGDLQVRIYRLADAEDSYQQALDLFQQIQSRHGEASTRRALGALQFRTARFADADASFLQALALYRQIEDRLGEAATLCALGDLQVGTERLAGAENSYQQALVIYRQINVRLGEANALSGLGHLQSRLGRLAEAEKSYQQALAIYQQLGGGIGEANAIRGIGDLEVRTHRLAGAETSYLQALAISQQTEDRLGEADTLCALGDLQDHTHRLAEAESSYHQSLTLYQQIGDPLGEAHAVKGIGDLHFKFDRLSEAESSYRQALAICQQIGDQIDESRTLRALGDLQVRMARLTEAENSYQPALAICQRIEDRIGEAATLRALGELRARMARLADAESFYRQALAIYQQIGDRIGEAYAAKGLGAVLVRTGRIADAKASYRQVLSDFRQVEDRLGEAGTLGALGDLQVRTDRLADAEDSYQEALAVYRDIQDRPGEANTLRALGDLQYRTDRLADAEGSYRQAQALYRQVEEPLGKANTLLSVGVLQVRTGQIADAEVNYREAMTLYRQAEDPSGEANSLHALGALQTSTGRPADAEDSLRQALALYRHAKDRNGEAHALYALGDLQVRADQLAEAGDSYHQALALYRQTENRLGEANTLKRIGEFSSQKREYDQAEAAFDAAMAIFEAIDDRYSTVSILMSRGRHRAALGRVDSFADWHRALILAGTVDSSLFAQIAAWIMEDIRRILVAGASNFLLSALPQLLDVDDSAEPSVGQRRGAYATVLSALRVIYELAAIRTLGLPPALGSSAALLQRARQLDAETASAFELAALALETLDLVSAPIGDQRLVGLISAWVQTPTWEESQAFLTEHEKELLSADAVAALDAFATASPRSETLRVHLNLVDAAQRIGVDSAYREQRDEWEARTSGAQPN